MERQADTRPPATRTSSNIGDKVLERQADTCPPATRTSSNIGDKALERQADTRPPATRTNFNNGDKVLVRDFREPTALAPWNSLCQYRPAELSSGNRSWRELAQTC